MNETHTVSFSRRFGFQWKMNITHLVVIVINTTEGKHTGRRGCYRVAVWCVERQGASPSYTETWASTLALRLLG